MEMVTDRGDQQPRVNYDESKDWAESKADGARDVELSSSVREPNSMPELSQLLFVQCLTKKTR